MRLLFLYLFLIFTFQHLQAQTTIAYFDSMVESISSVNTLEYELHAKELIDDKIFYTHSRVKLQKEPFCFYNYIIKPDIGVEILFTHKNKYAFINPNGFPFINLKLDPSGKLIRRNQHHTLFDAGFDNFKNIVLSVLELLKVSPDRYIIESVKLEQVNSYLNASDVGIMLREKHDLNLYVNSNVWINKCLGIGMEPDENFGLRINGNIQITGKIINLTDSCNLSCNFDLKNYVKKENLEDLVNKYELLYSVSNFIDVNNRIDNINQTPFTINDYSICLNDKQVNINYFENLDINSNFELGINKDKKVTYPSLFVGSSSNTHSNGHEILFRGIVCDNDIAAYSDSNIKYDIKPLKNSLQNLLKLEGIKYKRKDLETNLEYIGLIAQNVEKYYPELVSNHNNTKILAYQNIVAIIIEAIKELYELIKT